MKKLIIALAVATSLTGFAVAQEWKVTGERPATPADYKTYKTEQEAIDAIKQGQATQPTYTPLDRNYIFGSVGSTTGKKSSAAFSLGYGYEVWQTLDSKGTIAIEGAYTRLNGKKLSSLGNENTGGGKYAINKKNLVELGAKATYRFYDIESVNLGVYGKAGVASTTLKDFKHLTPYVGAGVELNPKGTQWVFDLGVKTYTNARNAEITYKPADVTGEYKTSKSLTTVNLGVTYHF